VKKERMKWDARSVRHKNGRRTKETEIKGTRTIKENQEEESKREKTQGNKEQLRTNKDKTKRSRDRSK